MASCAPKPERSRELTELYSEVDSEIGRSQEYMAQREQRLAQLKDALSKETDLRSRIGYLQDLTHEYRAYNSDSALRYITEIEHLAQAQHDQREATGAKLLKADIASHAGLFNEAHALLGSVDRRMLDSAQYGTLCSVYCALYQYESEYLPEGEEKTRARRLRDAYTDSLIQMGKPGSFDYINNTAMRDIKAGHPARVIHDLKHELTHYRSGDREYSILASVLANAYKAAGDLESYKKYLAITVISDIRGATKENMAIRDLATQVYEEGDLERAKRYVKVSLEDANFYASRLRDAQLNHLFPAIDKAYDRQQQDLRSRLQVYLGALAGLLIIVICAVAYIARQWHSVEEANQREQQTNAELQTISDRLREANSALEVSNTALEKSNTALESTNSALADSNSRLKKSGRIAEEYTGLFMEYSSLNISLLEKYHKALRNLALQGNIKGLLRKLDSDEIVNETLKAFYSKFDEAVLNIYPHFVEKVNELLTEEGRIQIKPGEKLNTELRVLAVMRLGISDADQIARFLRCSVATVYTYRSRLKRRAQDPETFESSILEV